MSTPTQPLPPTTLITLPSLPETLLLSPTAFRAANPHIHALLAAAIIFHPSHTNPPRVLLVRRAASDSWPLLWETPGGSVDASDVSIAAAAVRELWEETGLRGKSVLAAAAPSVEELARSENVSGKGPPGAWTLDQTSGLPVFVETGNIWARATVVVDCGPDEQVSLRPEEHAEAAWLTEEEVREGWIQNENGERRTLDMVSEGVRQTVLAAFRLRKETNGWKED